jgi:hypothetical protein
VVIIEQAAGAIKFRIPPEAKPGRFALMILTRDVAPKLIEQPVKVVVEADTAALTRLRGKSAQWTCQIAVDSRRKPALKFVSAPAYEGAVLS